MTEVESHQRSESQARVALDGRADARMESKNVLPAQDIGDQASREIHTRDVASDGGGQCANENQINSATTIAEIQEQWRRRQAWHRAEKSLTLTIKAICRRLCDGDKTEAGKLYKALVASGDEPSRSVAFGACLPLLNAREGIESHRKLVEKRLAELVKTLPVCDWWCSHHGCAEGGLASIIGEAGNLSRYSTKSKLRKRMGVAVINGERQRRIKDVEMAVEHGYSPSRRAVLWTIGQAIIQNGAGSKYREIYDERKPFELERCDTKGHAHNSAKRYMEKRLLDDLWKEWKRCTGSMAAS